MNIPGLILLFIAAVVGGGINSVAGGGSLIAFPSLLAFGVPAVIANATNTAALLPGSISSAIAYRQDIPDQRKLLITLAVPSVIGGYTGARLARRVNQDVVRGFVVVAGLAVSAWLFIKPLG